jgi:hypothetical protein
MNTTTILDLIAARQAAAAAALDELREQQAKLAAEADAVLDRLDDAGGWSPSIRHSRCRVSWLA